MDCLQRFVVVGQTPQDNAGMDSALYMKSYEYQAGNLLVANREEVIICPAPRRPKSPYTVDHLNRLSCRPKSNLHAQRGGGGLEFLDIFLTKDDFEDDSHSSNSRGFFCGSPPVRTNNPVVRDAQFEGQALSHIASASPSGKSSGRVERVTYCGTVSSFGGKPKPKVRIEGFSCGSPESQCIVSALA